MFDLKNQNLGSFVGAFISEGNMPIKGAVKITCKNVEFLNFASSAITKVVGKKACTDLPPTPEHRTKNFAFHKFYSPVVRKLLEKDLGILSGKRIVNDQGLPELITNSLDNLEKNSWVKNWMKSYFQMRFSGDGEVRRKRKEIVLTKCKALLNLDEKLINEIRKNYENGKSIYSYPKDIQNQLRQEASKRENFPREFKDVQKILEIVFGIKSEIQKGWIRVIYFDKLRNIFVISSVYRLIISGIHNIEKFYEEINFPIIDEVNRKKVEVILKRK